MVKSPCSKLRNDSSFEKLEYITSSQVRGNYVRKREAIRMTYEKRDETLGNVHDGGTHRKTDGEKVEIVQAEIDGEMIEHRICLKRPTNKTAGPFGDKAKVYRESYR